jgi:lipase
LILRTRCWGPEQPDAVLCVHGVAQHGGIFSPLGERLAAAGRRVVAVDLRGHRDSSHLPPWSIGAHVADLFETLDSLGVERATWVGHSFGGRIVATAAAERPGRVSGVVLLDPAYVVPPEVALQSAEVERLDWSFATAEGAINALLSAGRVVDPPREVVAAYVEDDLRKGPDGRLRFSYSPSAVVTAWSEMTLPVPPVALVPTLMIRPEVPLFDPVVADAIYRNALGEELTEVTVPKGHNVFWEAPEETVSAIEEFLGAVV